MSPILVTLACALCATGASHQSVARRYPPAKLVAHPGDLPGFRYGEFKTRAWTSPIRFVDEGAEDTPAEAKVDSQRLRGEGFVEAVQEEFANQGAAGVSVTIVLASAKGARGELEANASAERAAPEPVTSFIATGVPASEGFTGVQEEGRRRYADLLFTVGRCFFGVGNAWYGPSSEYEATLAPVAAARALYRRTKRVCAST
jgi:hypothetical protein